MYSFHFRWKEVLLNLCLLKSQLRPQLKPQLTFQLHAGFDVMATVPNKPVNDLFDSNWKSQDAAQRLRAVAQLGSDGRKGQPALIQIALHDEHEKVRIGAIKHISDVDVLVKLQAQQGLLQESASQQYFRILAGSFDSEITEAQRLTRIRDLSSAGIKQIALLAKCKAAGSEAMNLIEAPEELMDLSLFAASVHVRKHAALKITDTALLLELREKVRGKDKTVFKVVDQRILQQTEAQQQHLSGDSSGAPISNSKSKPKSKPEAKPEQQKSNTANTKPAASKDKPASSSRTDADKTADNRLKAAASNATSPNPKTAAIDPDALFVKLKQELERTSYKNTGRLNALRMNVNELRKAVAETRKELKKNTNTLHTTLLEMQEKNKNFQEQLKISTTALLLVLKQALEDGQSHQALPAWDKIQGNISNTRGKLRAILQKQANEHKDQLNELRDWKIFAATEKKKGLIDQMQHLIESKMHAADRSRHIGTLHKEWKALGRSSQNEALWREFKKLSDKAYEPCKEYFNQRKQLMVSNLKKRREICEKLEQELKNVNEDSINISSLNTLLRDSEIEWKQFAPIEQSKIKSLQKRYYGLVNQFRKFRKNAVRSNSRQKQDYVEQAQSLAASDDNKNAMSEAKRLQQEWEKLGPTSYRDDKKFWEDFRAACDKIFSQRSQQTVTDRENQNRAEKNLGNILQSIEAIFALEEDNFRKSRADYQELIQQFSTTMDPRVKNQRKRLLDQFNGLKRKIDSRFSALPNKKHLQLKNAVLAKSAFLDQLEAKLLSSKDVQQFTEIIEQVDRKAWEEIETIGNAEYEHTLHNRLQQSVNASSVEELHKLTQECEVHVRSLCIDLEIRANIDTPTEDQALRMKIQLDQLKNGFGQSKPDYKENLKHAMAVELKSFCIGPLNTEVQEQLSQRLQSAIKKLM